MFKRCSHFLFFSLASCTLVTLNGMNSEEGKKYSRRELEKKMYDSSEFGIKEKIGRAINAKNKKVIEDYKKTHPALIQEYLDYELYLLLNAEQTQDMSTSINRFLENVKVLGLKPSMGKVIARVALNGIRFKLPLTRISALAPYIDQSDLSDFESDLKNVNFNPEEQKRLEEIKKILGYSKEKLG